MPKVLEITEEIKNSMIEMYRNGVPVLKISRKLKELYDFDISFSSVQNRMNEWKIKKDVNISEGNFNDVLKSGEYLDEDDKEQQEIHESLEPKIKKSLKYKESD